MIKKGTKERKYRQLKYNDKIEYLNDKMYRTEKNENFTCKQVRQEGMTIDLI